jgi:hypothetical protein
MSLPSEGFATTFRKSLITLLFIFNAIGNIFAVTYDIVYVRQPRFGNNTNTTWPEVSHPGRIDPGADLMLLHPNGNEEVLVNAGTGAVTDPFVSFDGQWVYYSYFYEPGNINTQRGLPHSGADIFKIHLGTRQIVQLTHGEFSPNMGSGNWDESDPENPPPGYNYLGYGILNLGPAPVAGGKIAFVSNRNAFIPPQGLTNPTLQLFVMDDDGSNVTPIAPMTIGSALHPTPLKNGRIMFSTLESQGNRDGRVWGIWSIYPDGRNWQPVVSAFRQAQAFHFMTQLSNEDIIVCDYYNLNNNGFGALYRFPVNSPPGTPPFHSAFPADNPSIQQTVEQGFLYPFKMAFTPRGMFSISPFTHGNDEAAPVGAGGVRVGKFTHPSAAPNNDLLVGWTPGPANDLDRPTPTPYYNSGIYVIPGGNIVNGPSDLVLIKNNAQYNEAWPRAVVPYSAIHGVSEPTVIPWLPNDGTLHSALPEGTPYGLVGTSSLYKRESFPGFSTGTNIYNGLDVFNTSQNEQSSNWLWQGSDAGKYNNSAIWAIRILAMEPNTHRSYGPNSTCCGPGGFQWFFSHAMERLRILGEIPVRKFDGNNNPILDQEGNPDTSFLAKIPADSPFTFQMLDSNGMVLSMAQTWHQVRPGEIRANCGGCHAHSQQPLDFNTTVAGSPGYQPWDLTSMTPLVTHDTQGNPTIRTEATSVVNVEFYQHIRPLLQRSCVPCHSSTNATPHGNLDLDDTSIDGPTGLARDYVKLARDEGARWGYPPIIVNGTWRQTNASRYIRRFQSRRSLLIWKIFGQRLDGWTNGDHPTETTLGDPSTIVPPGSNRNDADIDYTGTIMPPVGSGVQALTIDEKMTFARWIDLGCPINFGVESGHGNLGWFLDDMRPSLNINQPRPGQNSSVIGEIRFGTADAYTGIDPASLSITSDISIAGRPPGAELFDLAQNVAPGVYSIQVSPPLTQAQNAHIHVESADQEGNISRVNQEFSVGAPQFLFHDDFEDGDASDWTFLKATWSVVSGALTGDTKKKGDALAPYTGCSGCTIEADIQFNVSGGKVSLLIFFQDKKNYTEVILSDKKDKLQVIQKINGSKVVKLKASVVFNPGVSYRIRINLNSGMYTVSVDGVVVVSGAAQGSPNGTVGFRIKDATASFKEITVF